MRQLACTMECSRPEPCAPVVRTANCPSAPVLTWARRYSVRPGCLRMLWLHRAGTNKGAVGVAPIKRCSAGRTKAKKLTMAATGLPGRPKSQVDSLF